MSKYMAFESEAFANRELLVEALREMGFEEITQGNDVLLQGWDKRDERLTNIPSDAGKMTRNDLRFIQTITLWD